MIKHTRIIAILATTLVLLVPAHAQTLVPSSQQQSRRTVYLLDIHYEGVKSENYIDGFAEQLLSLRIGQLKSYDVKKRERDKEPQCTSEGVVAPNLKQVTIGSDANHYVVKATIITREPEKGVREAVLNYELLKCRKAGAQVSLAQNNHTFPYTEVLNYLNSMADAISFVLQQELEVTKIRIDFKGVKPKTASETTFAEKLGEKLLDRLKDAQEFDPRVVGTATPAGTPAEYAISGRVLTQNSKLLFEVDIRNRRDKKFFTVFDGPTTNELGDAQKLEEFLREKSLLAVDYLTFVRNIADTESAPAPNDNEADRALRMSRDLLCRTEVPAVGCFPQASPAADLLTEVVKNRKFNTAEVWELLADALLRAGENNRAASAFEMTARLAAQEGKSAAVADLLDKAGSAWLEARSFVEAGSVYDRLLKLTPSRPSAHSGRAKIYRYNNERLKGLEFLLDSLDSLPDSKELTEEMEFLASSLLEEEIKPALKILELKKEKPSAALALRLLRPKVANPSH